MISSIERNQLRMSKSKKQIEDMKKELTEEDKLRLKFIDQDLRNLSTPQQEIKEDIINEQQHEVKLKRHYNKNKYKEVERETAQVEPEEVVKNTFIAHPNLEVVKFVIDYIWRVTTSRKRGDNFILNSDNFIKFQSLITQDNEDDIEIVLEEPLIQSHSCMAKKYKKNDFVGVMDVLIKNVNISIIDNVLWNLVEKLYRVNKGLRQIIRQTIIRNRYKRILILFVQLSYSLFFKQEESLIEPTEEELINVQKQLQEIQQKQQEVKQLKKLQKQQISFIDIEIIKLFTYFSLYMKSKDVELSNLMTIDTDQIVTGYKQFVQSIITEQFIKTNGTNNQILSANGDTVDKDKLDYQPIEVATQQSISYGMYEQRIWGALTTQNGSIYISLQITHSDSSTLTELGYTMFSIINNAIKLKFTGTTRNISINAVMFAQKGYGYPILWNGAITIDCFINSNGNIIINTMCQLHLPDDFCVSFCESYAINNQS